MVLAGLKGEFGLQEQIISNDQAFRDGFRHRKSYPGLVIVATLVRRVDRPEALLNRECNQALRLVLLPGGSVHEAGH